MIRQVIKMILATNKRPENLILSVDAYFNAIVITTKWDERSKYFMKMIDRAEPCDGTSITTPYGVADASDLSTGCKTLLTLHYLRTNNLNHALNISECGDNVFELLMEEADNSGILLYSSLGVHPSIKESYSYIINGKKVGSLSALEVDDEDYI